MKISCLKEDLAHGLSVVNHAVPNRAPLAITQNVLLCAKDSKLKLSATNLEIFITTWAGAVIEEEGDITVPRPAADRAGQLPAQRTDRPGAAGGIRATPPRLRPGHGPHQQRRRQGVPANPGHRRGHDRHG